MKDYKDLEEAIIIFNSLVGEKEDCQTVKKLLKENQQLNLQLSGYRQAILSDKEMLGLQQENEQLKDLYVRTCNHLFNIGNDELARYFQAQIGECNVFTPQEVRNKEV